MQFGITPVAGNVPGFGIWEDIPIEARPCTPTPLCFTFSP